MPVPEEVSEDLPSVVYRDEIQMPSAEEKYLNSFQRRNVSKHK